MTDLLCEKHKIKLDCLAGRNAHRSNWYCSECEQDKEINERLAKSMGWKLELSKFNYRDPTTFAENLEWLLNSEGNGCGKYRLYVDGGRYRIDDRCENLLSLDKSMCKCIALARIAADEPDPWRKWTLTEAGERAGLKTPKMKR